VAHSTLRKLTDVKGISDQKAIKLKEIIKANNLVSLGFQTATSKLEGMRDLIMISTGTPVYFWHLVFV
jgi:DNA repair protein RAD51